MTKISLEMGPNGINVFVHFGFAFQFALEIVIISYLQLRESYSNSGIGEFSKKIHLYSELIFPINMLVSE